MVSNPRLGTPNAQLGSLPLGEMGYDGIASVAASTVTRGSFVTNVATSTIAVKMTVRSAVASAAVLATRFASAAATTVVKQTLTLSAPTNTVIAAKFIASAPTSTYVVGNQGPLVAPMTVALFPEAPIVYKGHKPSRSAVGLDTLQLLPVLYDTDPAPQPALAVSIATVIPPSAATSAAIQQNNPTTAPYIHRLDNVLSSRLGSGTYQVAYTFYRDTGETALSPSSTVNIDSPLTQGIQIGTIPLPNGITAVRFYVKSPGANEFILSATSLTGQALVLDNVGETISVRVDGTLFEVAATDGELPAFSCDLRDFTVATLAYTIELAGYLADVYSGWEDIAATVLLDQAYGPVTSVDLVGFTSVLWRVIRPLALVFDLWGDDMDESARQIDVRYAAGRWLDWWGVLYGVPRQSNESDTAYRRRITWEVMAPRTNNVAMEFILKEALGYDSTISDTSSLGRTWYSNKLPVGATVRDPASGVPLAIVADPQGAFVPGLTAWDSLSSYNTTTFTWTTTDTSVLDWGQSKPAGVLIDPGSAGVTWPGTPGRFHVLINQVVEDGQLGIDAIIDLINRYKAAGFLFTLSLKNFYREVFDTLNQVKENYTEEWRETYTGPAGMFYTTGTMAALTMKWPPPPAREAFIFEEWSYDNGVTYTPNGTTAVISRVNDPRHRIRRGLGAKDDVVPAGAPGLVLTG